MYAGKEAKHPTDAERERLRKLKGKDKMPDPELDDEEDDEDADEDLEGGSDSGSEAGSPCYSTRAPLLLLGPSLSY